MTRTRRQSATELQWREQARQAHEARERHARWETKRAAEELVWLLHRLRFRCEQCGVGGDQSRRCGPRARTSCPHTHLAVYQTTSLYLILI